MFINAFFNLVVPFIVFVSLIAWLFLRFGKEYLPNQTKEEKERRDQINKKYKITKGFVLISLLSLLVYGGLIAEVFNKFGNVFFSYVVSVLLFLPAFSLFAVLVLIHSYIVHFFGKSQKS